MPLPSRVTRLASGLMSSSALRKAARIRSSRSLRSPAGSVAGSGKHRQDLRAQLDQARHRGLARLGLGGVEALDELEHAVAQGRVRRFGLAASRRGPASAKQASAGDQPSSDMTSGTASHDLVPRFGVCMQINR